MHTIHGPENELDLNNEDGNHASKIEWIPDQLFHHLLRDLHRSLVTNAPLASLLRISRLWAVFVDLRLYLTYVRS